ncbi:MAG: TonB-dependent receptor [Tannerellaceae bacterium]|nr:TonB-dependent receptor [Tannerellaceae bacterium]
MNKRYWSIIFTLWISFHSLGAEEKNTTPKDTIQTYNIDEVIITSSTKETNDFRTLPGAVSLISPQTIANRQIEALKDISSLVPNLYIPDYGARLTSAIYIRGIGARSSGQSVGLYVDNIPYLDKSTFDFELTDIQRIEVLRGPQGTLYGRNAMGGIINVYTLSHMNYQGTRLSGSVGNYGTYKGKLSHYTKFSETIGISIGGYYDQHNGFFTNIYTHKKADPEKSAGGRIRLDWQITPNVKAGYTISYDYTDQSAFPYGLYHRETGNIDPVNINDPVSYQRNMLSNHLSLEYQTSSFVLTSTTGYQYLKDDMLMDQDFSPLSIFILNQKQKQNAYSQEFAIKSNLTRNYQWSFGLYGFYNDLHTDGPVTFKEDGVSQVLQKVFDDLYYHTNMPVHLKVMDKEVYIPGSFDTPSYGVALFHQSTYNNLFTKGLSLTAGIRLDYEKQQMDYQSAAKMSLGIGGSPEGNHTELQGIEPTVMDIHTSQDFWQALPKVSLKYTCTPQTFTYISVAKGYKTGGYNVQMSADLMQSQMQYELMNQFMPSMAIEPASVEDVASYTPEHSWNYELGIKSEVIKNYLTSELTFFYMDVEDVQITQFVNSGNGRILTNAGKAQSYGVEASVKTSIRNVSADLNYGYTHATFRDYNNGEENFKGKFIPYAPRHTLSAGIHYNKLVSHALIDQFTASAQFNGAGKIFWTEYNDIFQKFYGTVQAKIGIRKGSVKVDLWSKNLTDTQFTAFYFESFDNPFMQRGKPFQIGADFTIIFN